MNKIKLAIIGSAGFGWSHLVGMLDNDNVEVVMLCDTNEEGVKKLSDMYYIPYTTDAQDIFENPEIVGVSIALPDQLHAEYTIKALRAGKHVLCEKPMTLDPAESKEMIKAAEQTGKILMIGQICRFTPSFVKIKKLVDSGEIGELFFVESEYAHDYSKIAGPGNWRCTPERHPIIGGGCHAVDLLRWIAGDPIETYAYSNQKVLTDWPVEDATIAIMQFPDNVIGKVFCSTGCQRKYTMRTVIYGTKGTIIADNTSPTISIYKKDIEGKEKMFDSEANVLEIKIPVSVNNHNIGQEIKEFVRCISENDMPAMSGVEGMKTVAACAAIVEAAKKHTPIKINYEI